MALLTAASIAPHLDDAVAKLLRRGSGGRRSEAEAPLPIDTGAMAVAHELRSELNGWARIIADQHLTAMPPDTIAATAMWLAARLNELRQNEAAADAHRGIVRAVSRAVAAVDRQPERAPAGLCDNCGCQLLAELGADSVTCGCGMTVLALQDKRRERAAAADVLGTPAELSAVLAKIGYTVSPGTISAWGTRGQIEKRAGGFYRLSEALAMAAKMGTRRVRLANLT